MSEQETYIRVRDVMTENVHTVDGLDTIRDAIAHMRETQFSALIVERRDEKDEYGLLTVKEIARQVIEPNRSPDRTSVYEIMEKPVLSLDPEMNIRYAIRLLVQFDLNRALVVDNGKAIGIITLRDMVFRYLDHCSK